MSPLVLIFVVALICLLLGLVGVAKVLIWIGVVILIVAAVLAVADRAS